MSFASVATLVGLAINTAAVVALIWHARILIRQVSHAYQATEADHERRRRQATVELCTELNEKLVELRHLISWRAEEEAIATFDDETEAGIQNIIARTRFLNAYETVAAGVRFDIYDLDILVESIGHAVMKTEESFRSHIREHRDESGNPNAWEHLEWLAGVVRKRRNVPAADD